MIKKYKNSKVLITIVGIILLVSALSACSAFTPGEAENGATEASGTISATTVGVSSEIGGKIMEVFAAEGDTVQAGDPLFHLDDELLQAQYNQAQAAVQTAEATVEAARAQLASAKIQYDLAVQGARAQDIENRLAAWTEDSSDEVELDPVAAGCDVLD